MQPARLGAIQSYTCDQCGSTWLDPTTFVGLCADRETRTAVISLLDVPVDAGGSPPADEKVRYRHCAVCDTIMSRVNFGKTSGVVIDVCKGHGVWFEHGELAGVLRFIALGGLDLMRIKAAQRAVTRIRAKGGNPDVSSDEAALAAIEVGRVTRVDPTGATPREPDPATLRWVLQNLLS